MTKTRNVDGCADIRVGTLCRVLCTGKLYDIVNERDDETYVKEGDAAIVIGNDMYESEHGGRRVMYLILVPSGVGWLAPFWLQVIQEP